MENPVQSQYTNYIILFCSIQAVNQIPVYWTNDYVALS